VSNQNDPVIIGTGSNVLRQLIPKMDVNRVATIPLTLANQGRGEVHIQTIITEYETALGRSNKSSFTLVHNAIFR
jgi:hypothetical protein